MSREAIDTWVTILIEVVDTFKPDRHILVMNDLTHRKQGVTPYSLKRAEDLVSYLNESGLTASVAMVLRDTILSRLIQIFFQSRLTRESRQRITMRVYLDGQQEEAFDWLSSQLD